jgi:hypothetical protein
LNMPRMGATSISQNSCEKTASKASRRNPDPPRAQAAKLIQLSPRKIPNPEASITGSFGEPDDSQKLAIFRVGFWVG